ncbi:MAG: GNAT family N-acetyltransferase [Anaerolineales bacterium]|jgi:RimJ/RimL family protein N-acetyltransferase
MNDLHISYRPAEKKHARVFVNWQYEPPYDVYNCPPEEIGDAVQYNIDPANNVYAMLDQNEALIGYCSYGKDAQVPGGDYSEEALDIGLMIKPELTGQGMGTVFVEEVIQNGIEKYAPEKLRVTIAAFNKRAIRVWEKNGFQQSQNFSREGAGMEFVIMKKEL